MVKMSSWDLCASRMHHLVPDSNSLYRIVYFIIFIMFVNILSCLTTTVEHTVVKTHLSSNKTDQEHLLINNENSINNQTESSFLNQSTGDAQERKLESAHNLTNHLSEDKMKVQSTHNQDTTTTSSTDDTDEDINNLYLQKTIANHLLNFATTLSSLTRDKVATERNSNDNLTQNSDNTRDEYLTVSHTLDSVTTTTPIVMKIARSVNTKPLQSLNISTTSEPLRTFFRPLEQEYWNHPKLLNKKSNELYTPALSHSNPLNQSDSLRAHRQVVSHVLPAKHGKVPLLSNTSLIDLILLIKQLKAAQLEQQAPTRHPVAHLDKSADYQSSPTLISLIGKPTPVELYVADSSNNNPINLDSVMKPDQPGEERNDFFAPKPSRYALVSPYSAHFDTGLNRNRINDSYVQEKSQSDNSRFPGEDNHRSRNPSKQFIYDQQGYELQDNRDVSNNHLVPNSMNMFRVEDHIKSDFSKMFGASSDNQEYTTRLVKPSYSTVSPMDFSFRPNNPEVSVKDKGLASVEIKKLSHSKKDNKPTLESTSTTITLQKYPKTTTSDKANEEKNESTFFDKLQKPKQPVDDVPDLSMEGENLPSLTSQHLREPLSLQGVINPLFEDALAGMAPKPVTFGDLFAHHGVPFRLKSPYGESYSVSDFENKFQDASGSQIDDIVYMPYGSKVQDMNSIKLLKSLKKNIALTNNLESFPMDSSEPSNLLLNDFYNNFDSAPSHLPLAWARLPRDISDESVLQPTLFPQLPKNSPYSGSSMMLPMASVFDQSFANLPSSSSLVADHSSFVSAANSTNPVNIMLPDLSHRWALSRMPDLIPIPLAATVPGYLIKMPDGQILAAALTNSFSIQGIQKGPFSPGYKNFLNQRLKSLLKPNAPKLVQPPLYGNLAQSSINPIVVVGPNRHLHTQNNLKMNHHNNRYVTATNEKGGIFTRAVLNHLGFRAGLRTTIRPADMKRPKGNYDRQKLLKLMSLQQPMMSWTRDKELPLANLNDPVFSFADNDNLPLESSAEDQLSSLMFSTSPIHTTDTNIHNESRLKSKLSQLIKLKNIFGGAEGLKSGIEKRNWPPPGGFEPPTFWLTAKRASRLRHGGSCLLCRR